MARRPGGLELIRRIAGRLQDREFIRRVNGWLAVFWAVWFVPAVALKRLRESLLLIAVYSIWANLISHYTAWLTARVDVHVGGNGG